MKRTLAMLMLVGCSRPVVEYASQDAGLVVYAAPPPVTGQTDIEMVWSNGRRMVDPQGLERACEFGVMRYGDMELTAVQRRRGWDGDAASPMRVTPAEVDAVKSAVEKKLGECRQNPPVMWQFVLDAGVGDGGAGG